jgi:hypothetical protein
VVFMHKTFVCLYLANEFLFSRQKYVLDFLYILYGFACATYAIMYRYLYMHIYI